MAWQLHGNEKQIRRFCGWAERLGNEQFKDKNEADIGLRDVSFPKSILSTHALYMYLVFVSPRTQRRGDKLAQTRRLHVEQTVVL